MEGELAWWSNPGSGRNYSKTTSAWTLSPARRIVMLGCIARQAAGDGGSQAESIPGSTIDLGTWNKTSIKMSGSSCFLNINS